MVCVNCGKNLIRGYAFCLDCGSPVPPEALEEGGMPGRTDNEGKPRAEAADAPKTESEPETPVSEVQSSMPGIEPLDSGRTTETLVFCPNCGMHMQSSPVQCNKCGMFLGDKPKNVPLSEGGVPLMNTDPMAVGGTLDGFGGGLGDISDGELDQINSFMNGGGIVPVFAEEDNSSPDLFGNGISANDFAALTEQLASFSAANEMPSIEAVEHEPKKQPSKSNDRQVDNFSMSDDDAPSVVPVSDGAVPVIGNYSMDEEPSENVDLDPYKFLNNSLGDMPEPLFSKTVPKAPAAPAPKPVEPAPEPVRHERFEPIFGSSAPAPSVPEKLEERPKREQPEPVQPARPIPPPVSEEAPFIAETAAPVISEFASSAPTVSSQAEPSPFGSEDIFGLPSPAPAPRNSAVETVPHGNIFRCQFCGGTMYDTDKFCPSCGASYKNGAAKSRGGKSKAPLLIVAAALAVIAAGGFFVFGALNNRGDNSEPSSVVNGGSSLSEVSSESATTSEESSPTETSETSSESSASTAPNSSAGTPPSSTGAPPDFTRPSSSSTSTPQNSTDLPQNSTSLPQSSTGTPSSFPGPPPNFTAPTSSR